MNEPDMTIKEALGKYFQVYGFGAETYRNNWVLFRIGILSWYMPNPAARKKAVPLHDLHHIVAGYPAHFMGELHIASYELGCGVGPYLFAWLINLQGLLLGLLLCPLTSFRHFVRGRRSGSIYTLDMGIEELYAESVGSLQNRLSVAPQVQSLREAKLTDVFYFLMFAVLTMLMHLLPVLLIVLLFI